MADEKIFTIPLTKADTNNNPTGSLVMQIDKGQVVNINLDKLKEYANLKR